MELEITLETESDVCTVSLRGEVDVYTAPEFKRSLVGAIDEGCSHVVVDLEGVEFMDSSGLGVLVSGLRRIKERSGTIRLAAPREPIRKVFQITGLDRVFPIFDTVGEAGDVGP